MTNLGIKSIFQSLLAPKNGGGVYSGLKTFHRVVRFKEAPSPP